MEWMTMNIMNTLDQSSFDISLCIGKQFVSIFEDTSTPDELYIAMCKFIISLMDHYHDIPKEHTTSCLKALIGLLRLRKTDEL